LKISSITKFITLLLSVFPKKKEKNSSNVNQTPTKEYIWSTPRDKALTKASHLITIKPSSLISRLVLCHHQINSPTNPECPSTEIEWWITASSDKTPEWDNNINKTEICQWRICNLINLIPNLKTVWVVPKAKETTNPVNLTTRWDPRDNKTKVVCKTLLNKVDNNNHNNNPNKVKFLNRECNQTWWNPKFPDNKFPKIFKINHQANNLRPNNNQWLEWTRFLELICNKTQINPSLLSTILKITWKTF